MRRFLIAKGYEDCEIMMPHRSTRASAGYDLAALEPAEIKPYEAVPIPTGIKVQMAEDEVFLMFPRSSLAQKHGLRLANTVGVIDADYFGNSENDGHIQVVVYNFTSHIQHVEKGERIAQGVFVKYLKTDDDDATDSRRGGFGSTGRI